MCITEDGEEKRDEASWKSGSRRPFVCSPLFFCMLSILRRTGDSGPGPCSQSIASSGSEREPPGLPCSRGSGSARLRSRHNVKVLIVSMSLSKRRRLPALAALVECCGLIQSGHEVRTNSSERTAFPPIYCSIELWLGRNKLSAHHANFPSCKVPMACCVRHKPNKRWWRWDPLALLLLGGCTMLC